MVTYYDPLTEELQRSHLRLNDELIFCPQKYGDKTFVHVEVPSTSRFFRIGYAEYVFISQFDGQTSSATALAVTAQSQGSDAINEQKSREIIDWLLENGLAGFVGEKAGIDATTADKNKASLLSKLNPFWLKLSFGNPDRFFSAATRFCQWMFHPLTILVSLIFILAGLVTALTHWDEVFGGFQIWESSTWIWMIVCWVILKVVHEFAHGITCRRFGGEVSETGIIFILLAPMAYVNVTSSWRFANRWKRIAVASAGMYVELFVAACCVFGLLNTESPILQDMLRNAIIMSGLTTLLFNANPLMKFDGYFILSDLLKIPNLFENGSKAIRNNLSWAFLGQTQEASCHEIKTRRFVVLVYGWLAGVWKVLICFAMTIAASTMFGGFGILLAAMGVMSWFAKPTIETCKRLSIHFKRRPHSLVRVAAVTSLIAGFFVASWFWIPSPIVARVPCLIEFEDAANVRTETAGFIAEVIVEENATVEVGQPLLKLENLELVGEVGKLEAELQYQKTRERIALDQSETAEAQVAVAQQDAILTSLNSRLEELDRLTIKAPVAGRVVARNLAAMTGTYVEKGDLVLRITDETAKEVIVSLPVTEINSAKKMVGAKIPIQIGSRRTIYASVDHISPRATTLVSYPSLIDPNGGPLAVRQSTKVEDTEEDSPEFEFFEPRINAIATLEKPVAQNVWSGERGYAVLSSSTPTLGKWLFISSRDWIKKQLEIADPSASHRR